MTYAEVKTMLDGVEISQGVQVPNAYYQFEDDTGIAPPFICFYYTGSRDLYADNTNYQKIDHLVVELYTREKDFTLEANLESVLNAAGLTWSRAETRLDDERMYVEVYDMDVIIIPDDTEIITEGNNNA